MTLRLDCTLALRAFGCNTCPIEHESSATHSGDWRCRVGGVKTAAYLVRPGLEDEPRTRLFAQLRPTIQIGTRRFPDVSSYHHMIANHARGSSQDSMARLVA